MATVGVKGYRGPISLNFTVTPARKQMRTCMYSFESSGEKTDRVSKACRQIQLTHHSKPAYLLNVSVAYDILCQNKGKTIR